jgi:hypothetical protein
VLPLDASQGAADADAKAAEEKEAGTLDLL